MAAYIHPPGAACGEELLSVTLGLSLPQTGPDSEECLLNELKKNTSMIKITLMSALFSV